MYYDIHSFIHVFALLVTLFECLFCATTVSVPELPQLMRTRTRCPYSGCLQMGVGGEWMDNGNIGYSVNNLRVCQRGGSEKTCQRRRYLSRAKLCETRVRALQMEETACPSSGQGQKWQVGQRGVRGMSGWERRRGPGPRILKGIDVILRVILFTAFKLYVALHWIEFLYSSTQHIITKHLWGSRVECCGYSGEQDRHVSHLVKLTVWWESRQ